MLLTFESITVFLIGDTAVVSGNVYVNVLVYNDGAPVEIAIWFEPEPSPVFIGLHSAFIHIFRRCYLIQSWCNPCSPCSQLAHKKLLMGLQVSTCQNLRLLAHPITRTPPIQRSRTGSLLRDVVHYSWAVSHNNTPNLYIYI